MKKSFFPTYLDFVRIVATSLVFVLFFGIADAQIIAKWPLLKVKTGNALAATTVAPNVIAGAMIPVGGATFGNPAPGATGYRLKQNNTWPSSPNPTDTAYSLDFPLSSSTTTPTDIIITGLTLVDSVPTSSAGASLAIAPYYQIDGAGAWIMLAAPQSFPLTASTDVNYGTFNVPFYYNSRLQSGHTYKIRLYIYSPDGAVKGDYFSLANVIVYGNTQAATTPVPSVTTGQPHPSGKYSGTDTSTYDYGTIAGVTYQPPNFAGLTWSSTNTTPSVTNSPYSTNGGGGMIDSPITGLTANTTYYVRAFIITPFDTLYGQVYSFTTFGYTKPTVTTVAASNILSDKATSGGVVIDSGGLSIAQEGVCWSTTQGAETATSGNSFTNDGTSGTGFSSIAEVLLPSTTYYLKAYAKNSLGLTYGNEISFTTAAAVPFISAIPSSLSFGTVVINSPSTILSFKLTCGYLTPSLGTITVNPPIGFAISTSSNGGFVAAPLSIPYSSSTLSTIIYVKLLTTNYGANTGNILLSGGGAVNPNIDTVNLSGIVTTDPNILTNSGTDFWAGYGYEENMTNAAKKDGYGLSLYIAASSQAATVVVDLPLYSLAQKAAYNFPRTVNIPANTAIEVTGFPLGDSTDAKNTNNTIDSRLYFTGKTDRGIHVYSTNGVPVSVFMNDWATNNSEGATMLFPSNTWNSSYVVQAYGGESNTGVPNSYFFVIANEDSTVVTFTPSNSIIDSASSPIINGGNPGGTIKYIAGTSDTVILNAGQIFNAMGYVAIGGNKGNGIGVDLSGTTVSTTCDKKIAVFGGNGRVLVTTNLPAPGCSMNANTITGSDNLIQQMFPNVAWGTKYLTAPTKMMEYTIYRINVQDPTTNVWVNDPNHTTPLTGIVNNIYYQIENATPNVIESDKPICVTQFIIAGDCKNASNGNIAGGDPEMIILSPVQQPVTSSTVYAAPFKSTKTISGGGASYINVIIPNSGVSSFQLDGQTTGIDTGSSSYNGPAFAAAPQLINNMANAFIKHPGDTSYSYGRFRVNTGASHSLSSNVGFNAIAYGINTGNSAGESWGYNAGTAIKNLTAIVSTLTPYGSAPSATTCKGNNTSINISLPYAPSKVTSMQWISSSDSSVTPTNDTISVNAPASTGSFVSDGATYYTYQSPIQYKFDSVGTFKFTVVAYGTFTSQCGGSQTFNEVMTVVRDTTDFSFASVSCGSNQYNFTDLTKTVQGDVLTKWQWTFYNNSFDSIGSSQAEDTSFTFPSKAIYKVKLRTINNIGCFSDTTKTVSLLGGTTAQFIATPDTVCLGASITFDGSASNSTYGSLSSYNWDFNDGTKTTTTAPTVSHTYTTAGLYKATLNVMTALGCTSNIDTVSVLIASLPRANFTFGGVCLPGSTIFTNTSDTASGLVPYTYLWNFGDPSNPSNTSTSINGIHTYTSPTNPNGYIVKLIATNSVGCVDSISQTVTTIYDKPTASFTLSKAVACKGDLIQLTNTSIANNQTIGSLYWDFGDGQNLSGNNAAPTHIYDSVGLLTVRLAVISAPGGCLSDTVTQTIIVNPLPVPGFKLPSSCLTVGQQSVFIDTSKIDNTTYPTTPPHTIVSWSWNFNDASNTLGSNQQDGQHLFTSHNAGTYNVVETDTTNNGCFASDTIQFVIDGSKPKPGFEIASNPVCSNLPVQLIDTSRIDVGAITEVEIVWDVVNNPSIVLIDNAPSSGSAGSSKEYSNTYPDSTINEVYTIKLIASSGSSCLDSTSQTITVHGRPVVTFANQQGICANASPVKIVGATEIAGPAGPPGFTYSGQGVVGNTFDPTQAAVGIDSIKSLFTTSAGCEDSASSAIVVSPNVSLSFAQDSLHVCINDTITLSPVSTSANYYWSESDSMVNNTIFSSKTLKSINVSPKEDSTTYYVTTIPSSCPSTDSIKVYASPYPNLSIVSPSQKNSKDINDTTICFNGTATLTAQTTNGASITWSPGVTLLDSTALSTTASPADSTLYIVTATGSLYCVKSVYDTAIVLVQPKFSVGINIGNDTSIYIVPDESVYLNAFILDTSFHTPVTYTWSPATYLDNPDTSSPILKAPNLSTDSLIYTVTATTAQGCLADTSFKVYFYNQPDIYVPTAFTPNGDGKNDVLIPVPVGITHFDYFSVFNRWGQLVYHTTQLYQGWDGTFNGGQADLGAYIYETQGTDYAGKKHFHQGTIVLIR